MYYCSSREFGEGMLIYISYCLRLVKVLGSEVVSFSKKNLNSTDILWVRVATNYHLPLPDFRNNDVLA